LFVVLKFATIVYYTPAEYLTCGVTP